MYINRHTARTNPLYGPTDLIESYELPNWCVWVGTFKSFNKGRAANPEFYKMRVGDVFTTWPTLKAFCAHENGEVSEPNYYEWNGSKLIKTISSKSGKTTPL